MLGDELSTVLGRIVRKWGLLTFDEIDLQGYVAVQDVNLLHKLGYLRRNKSLGCSGWTITLSGMFEQFVRYSLQSDVHDFENPLLKPYSTFALDYYGLCGGYKIVYYEKLASGYRHPFVSYRVSSGTLKEWMYNYMYTIRQSSVSWFVGQANSSTNTKNRLFFEFCASVQEFKDNNK